MSRVMNISDDQDGLLELLHILDNAGITSENVRVGGDNVSFGNVTGLVEDILEIKEDEERYKLTINLRIIFLAGLMLLSVTGNCIALYVLTLGRNSLVGKRRSRTMFLHITLADILVTLFPMAGQMVWDMMDHWVAGWVFCKVFKFLQTFALTSSNYMILALSVERHRAVTKPLSVANSPYRFIVTAWILSLVPSVPNLFIFNITTLKKTAQTQNATDEVHNLLDYRQECVSDFAVFPSETVTKGYMISVFLVIFVIPLIIMLILYSHILIHLRETTKRIKSARKRELEHQELTTTNTRTSIRVNLPRNADRRYMSRAKEKTTNLALTVVTVFMITNTPFMLIEFMRRGIILDSWDSWCTKTFCAIFEAFIGVSIVSNSCLNPYIFLFFNSDNRKATNITTNCCLNRSDGEERATILSVSFRRNKNLDHSNSGNGNPVINERLNGGNDGGF